MQRRGEGIRLEAEAATIPPREWIDAMFPMYGFRQTLVTDIRAAIRQPPGLPEPILRRWQYVENETKYK